MTASSTSYSREIIISYSLMGPIIGGIVASIILIIYGGLTDEQGVLHGLMLGISFWRMWLFGSLFLSYTAGFVPALVVGIYVAAQVKKRKNLSAGIYYSLAILGSVMMPFLLTTNHNSANSEYSRFALYAFVGVTAAHLMLLHMRGKLSRRGISLTFHKSSPLGEQS